MDYFFFGGGGALRVAPPFEPLSVFGPEGFPQFCVGVPVVA